MSLPLMKLITLQSWSDGVKKWPIFFFFNIFSRVGIKWARLWGKKNHPYIEHTLLYSIQYLPKTCKISKLLKQNKNPNFLLIQLYDHQNKTIEITAHTFISTEKLKKTTDVSFISYIMEKRNGEFWWKNSQQNLLSYKRSKISSPAEPKW